MRFQRFGWRVEQLILLAIILLNILDFFELLDPFWDYVKKIVSWVLIGYLLYHVSISDILFGMRRKLFDILFVLAAFAMNISDLLQYATIERASMIIHAADYLAFTKQALTGAAQVVVSNVSEASWNTLTMLSVVPEAPARLIAHAPNITIASPSVSFLFERGAEQLSYAIMPYGVNGALLQWYNTLIPYADAIGRWGIIIGFLALLAMSIYAVFRFSVKKPSLIALFDKEGEPKGIPNLLLRFFFVMFALVFFYLFVFTLIMEWLAIAIDAPILMVGLCVSVLLIFIHKFNADWIESIGNFGSEFYMKFIRLFHYKKHILLGISGLLVLHVLTEIGNFLLPFVAPMRDPLYLSQLGAGHENLFVLAAQQFTGRLFADGALVAVTVMNIISWFFLLAIPGYIWYKIFRLRHAHPTEHARHYPDVAPWVLALFYSSTAVMLLVPLIKMQRLQLSGLIGVDFITRTVAAAGGVSPVEALLVGLAVFVPVFFLSLFRMKKWLMGGAFLASLALFGIYVFLFFLSSTVYYVHAVALTIATGDYFLAIAFFLFLITTVIFYISGYLVFIYEIVRD